MKLSIKNKRIKMKLSNLPIQCAFPFREPKVMYAFEIKIFMNKVAIPDSYREIG
jgi:hypothetical protein